MNFIDRKTLSVYKLLLNNKRGIHSPFYDLVYFYQIIGETAQAVRQYDYNVFCLHQQQEV
jgi:hypothetical protein